MKGKARGEKQQTSDALTNHSTQKMKSKQKFVAKSGAGPKKAGRGR